MSNGNQRRSFFNLLRSRFLFSGSRNSIFVEGQNNKHVDERAITNKERDGSITWSRSIYRLFLSLKQELSSMQGMAGDWLRCGARRITQGFPFVGGGGMSTEDRTR